MAPYTKLQADQVQKIAKSYGLKAVGFKPLEQGVANSNFVVDTNQGKFILTVCEIHPQIVAQMCNVLLLLEKHDFPAPRIRPLSNSQRHARYQGKPVLMKPYISGQLVENLSVKNLKQVGTALAQLHEIPTPAYLPRIHTYVENTLPQVMEQAFDQVYKKWVWKKHQFLIENTPSELPVGLVHGDLFWDNVLFESAQFKAIIDFESTCRINKIFDLGMAVVGLCANDTEIALKKTKALVSGYQHFRELEKAEKDCLQMYIEWTAVLTSTWRFWKYAIDEPGTEPARKHQQMVAFAENVRAIPKDAFYNAVFG